jgi:hypothetical protein
MKKREMIIIYLALLALTVIFFFLERLTHIEFLLHVAAIPLDALIIVFIVERFLHHREMQGKRRQLMYIKSCLFRSDMRNLFILNFRALKSPNITISQIKNASLDDLKQMREAARIVEYKSPDLMEPLIMEYVNTQSVWQSFMDLAITYDLEDIFESMVYLLHFIQDIKLFKDANPDKRFIDEAVKRKELMQKVDKVLGNGIRSFLDYAIELKMKNIEMFNQILSDYELAIQMTA